MIKEASLLIMLCLQSGVIYSQSDLDTKVYPPVKFELGTEGGPNRSSFFHFPIPGGIPDGVFDLGYPSFSAGITGLYHISSDFSIKAGLTYEGKGTTESIGTYYETSNFKYVGYTSMVVTRLNYITFHTMARHSFGRGNRFFLEGGPYLAYLIKTLVKTSYMDSTGKHVNIYPGYCPPIDAGLVMDFGYGITIGKNLTAELAARLDIGLVDMENSPITGQASSNESVALILALRYKL